jgi:hypothetical protein
MFGRLGEDFLSSIVTTDETWMYLYDPETKGQSRVWRELGTPPPVKARVSRLVGKQMYITFADMRGMILCHAIPPHTTVNAEYYSKVYR